MLLIIYAFVLAFFWCRAEFWLTPERFSNIHPTALSNFKKRLLNLYSRYAVFFIIAFILALINSYLASYFQHHGDFQAMRISVISITVLIIIFDLAVFFYILFQSIKNFQFFRLLKNSKAIL